MVRHEADIWMSAYGNSVSNSHVIAIGRSPWWWAIPHVRSAGGVGGPASRRSCDEPRSFRGGASGQATHAY